MPQKNFHVLLVAGVLFFSSHLFADVEKKSVEEKIESLGQRLMAELKDKAPEIKKVAIVRFVNLGPTAMENKIGEVVGELLQFYFKKNGYVCVERERINLILEELKLSMLGITEGDNAQKIGQLLEADAIITGSVNEVEGNFSIIARSVQVSSGKILSSVKLTVPVDDMVFLSDRYLVRKTRIEALYRSFIPGWGQFYNDQAWKAFIVIGLEAGAIGAAVYNELRAQRVYDSFYMKATDPDEAVKFYSNARNHRELRNAFIYTAVGIWALGIIDAVISGPSGKKVEVKRLEVAPLIREDYYALMIKGNF